MEGQWVAQYIPWFHGQVDQLQGLDVDGNHLLEEDDIQLLA